MTIPIEFPITFLVSCSKNILIVIVVDIEYPSPRHARGKVLVNAGLVACLARNVQESVYSQRGSHDSPARAAREGREGAKEGAKVKRTHESAAISNST